MTFLLPLQPLEHFLEIIETITTSDRDLRCNICKIIKQAQWQNLIDVQKVYRDAEAVSSFTVFNIKGNKYRLILDLDYSEQVAYFKYFLTHAQYDQQQWKNDPYY